MLIQIMYEKKSYTESRSKYIFMEEGSLKFHLYWQILQKPQDFCFIFYINIIQ